MDFRSDIFVQLKEWKRITKYTPTPAENELENKLEGHMRLQSMIAVTVGLTGGVFARLTRYKKMDVNRKLFYRLVPLTLGTYFLSTVVMIPWGLRHIRNYLESMMALKNSCLSDVTYIFVRASNPQDPWLSKYDREEFHDCIYKQKYQQAMTDLAIRAAVANRGSSNIREIEKNLFKLPNSM